MDIVSYSAASKVSKDEKYTRHDVLGENVAGAYQSMKERIDAIDNSIKNVTKQADKLIIQNAVNIMKANAKLNAIAKSKKYNMHQMIFDDLLDLSGIDLDKSSGYTHNALEGYIEGGTIITNTEEVDIIPKKAILIPEESIKEFAIKFNGTNQYIQIPNNPNLKQENSLFIEVKVTADWDAIRDKTCKIVSCTQTGGYNLALNDSNVNASGNYLGFIAYINKAYRSVSVPISELSGTHVIRVEFYYGNMKLFIDGKLADEQNYGDTITYHNSNSILIGAEVGAGSTAVGEYFPGIIHYFHVGTLNRSFEALWEFNEGEGNIVTDFINGLTANLINNPEWVLVTDSKKSSYDINNYEHKIKYFISRDDGVTWEKIEPETLFYFKDTISPLDNKIRIKAEIPGDIKLLNYALTWA